MGFFDFIFGNKKKEEQERLERERQAELQRKENERIAREREARLAENRRKEEERKARIFDENSKKYQILDFYLDCSHWNKQNEILEKTPLALPIKRIDIDDQEDIVQKYKVNSLPKLILVDLNGKEIKRWKGITESADINEYLYDNGYAVRPTIQEKRHSSNINEDMFKQTDKKLASQFVVESMSNFGYKPYSDFSEDFATSELQKQFSHYCLMAKSNLALDAVGQSPAFMAAFKQLIKDYIANTSNRDNKAMKYLYELDDMKLLTQQISMLALHANMKRVQNIASITHQEFHAAMNPEHVSLALGLYTYFTVIVNGNVDADKFNELFVESWINYYGNVQARLFMFKMRGNNWKNDFKGVLLDN